MSIPDDIDCPYCPPANPADEVYVHLIGEHRNKPLMAGARSEAVNLFDSIEPETTVDRGAADALVEDLGQVGEQHRGDG